jgi:hypothetical protein
MRNTKDLLELSMLADGSLADGLKAVARKLEPEQAQAALAQLVEVMQQENATRRTLGSVAECLGAVPGQLNRQQVQRASDRLVEVMQRTTDLDDLRSLANGLRALPAKLNPQLVIEVLKFPSCTNEVQKPLIEILERSAAPEKFEGSLWKAMDWADRARDADGRPRFDLHSPPKRQIYLGPGVHGVPDHDASRVFGSPDPAFGAPHVSLSGIHVYQ